MENTMTDKESKVGKVLQNFVVLGTLFMLKELLCAHHDCAGTCMDRMQLAYQIIKPMQDELGPVAHLTFEWDGGLVLNVHEPMMLAISAPVIMETLVGLKAEGFNVVFLEGQGGEA